jgi:hypothetical protein
MPDVITTTSEPAVAFQPSSLAPYPTTRESLDRTGLEHVQGNAGRLLISDVDDDDVGQFLVRDRPGHRGADGASSSHHCHFSVHE